MSYTNTLFSNITYTVLLHDWITIVILFSITILLSGTLYSQDAEAIKGSGQKNPETNSKKVCGDKLCEKPMSIKEKTDEYKSKLGESGLQQQALKPGLKLGIEKEKAKNSQVERPSMNLPNVINPPIEIVPLTAKNPIISTRDNFKPVGHDHNFPFESNIELINNHNSIDYESIRIPGMDSPQCTKEIVVYVHGIWNSKDDAITNFNETRQSLLNVNNTMYTNMILEQHSYPVVGFSWDSDTDKRVAFMIHGWKDANTISLKNGQKLAQFIVDYKKKCNDTNIRILAHSLGSRVTLEALKYLSNNLEFHDKITSVHLMAAAVDRKAVSVSNPTRYGNAIESTVCEFHNEYNIADDTLQWAYSVGELEDALGRMGASNDITLPSNYYETSVYNHLGNTPNVDPNDHSSYNGELKNGKLTHIGIMDIVANDWQKQSLENKCN